MTEQLLSIPPDELCTNELRARIADLVSQGQGLEEAVRGWADDARQALGTLNGGLARHSLDDAEHALVSTLTGASALVALASDLVDAADVLTAADPPLDDEPT